jgi:subtilisin family serine protease
MLASKGIVLCNSAGNSGNDKWKKIGTPADATDILAVGAIDANRENAEFSSVGYAADGRVKPDVMAMGLNSTVISAVGSVSNAHGTSFASPIMAGMVTSLWSALPELNAYQIMDIIRRSADRYSLPDNIFGYGIPDFGKAYELGRKK